MPERNPLAATVAQTWQAVLRDAVRDVGELARMLQLPIGALAAADEAAAQFPLLVPRGYIARMRAADASDPLLRQVLPLAVETVAAAGFCDDPLNELTYARHGVIRKYPGRTLLVTTAACPVHCRYCFRRAFPYREQNAADNDWADALTAVERLGDVAELILSGGDPLSLSDRKLEALFERIESTRTIRTVRLHTRFPIMIPERVTARLAALFSGTPLHVVVVIHVNHPHEIDSGVAAALSELKRSVIALLNQSVLLRGVNDDAATLAALSERLFDCGVLPYYLHQLDPVTGTQHFAVADVKALALLEALRSRLPGYLVPRLVREMPGQLSKTPL